MRDLWRTLCLMGFATTIYRDSSGAVYLLDLERSSGDPVRGIQRIPDAATLELAMAAQCWFASCVPPLVLVAAIGYAFLPLGWALTAFACLLCAFLLAQQPLRWVTRRCVTIPRSDFHRLELIKAPELAGLQFVTLARVGAAIFAIVAFAAPLSLSFSGAGEHWPKNADSAVEGLAFALLWLCFRLVYLGGWVINPDKLTFPPSTLRRDQGA